MANSDDLKLAALHWLRFQKQLNYVATECGHWSADVIGCDDRDLVEIEVKVSLSDLRAEFRNKVEKHEYYPDPLAKIEAINKTATASWGKKSTNLEKCWYPTHMYFLVTKELAQDALEIVNAVCPKYGIMYFYNHRGDSSVNSHHIHVLKSARMLRKKGVAEAVRDKVASRMASELINLKDRIKLLSLTEPKVK
jgi:hypothetical protein